MKKKKKIIFIVILSIILLTLIGGLIYLNHDKSDKNNKVNPSKVTDNKINNTSKKINLKLKKLEIQENDTYKLEDFIESCEIDNQECQLEYTNQEYAAYSKVGSYTIFIKAKSSDSEVIEKTTLEIKAKEEKSDNSDNKENKENKENNSNNKENNSNNTVNDNTNNTSNSNSLYVVDHTTEEKRNNTYKYGTTITTITTYYYDVYNDGSKKKTNETSRVEYNYNTFNATSNDLKQEATDLVNTYWDTLNAVLNNVNSYRNEVGLGNLEMVRDLCIAATIRSLEMGWSNNFSHTRPNGSDCYTILSDLNIPMYGMAAENIAYGYTSADSVSLGWKNSPGHYSNMINSSANKIGIGLAIVNGSYYWTQVFTG